MAIHWTGGGTKGEPRSGDWNTPGNWSSGDVPQAGDKVVLGGNVHSTAYVVTLDTSTNELELITIGGTGGVVTLDIESGGVLNVAKAVSLGNASISMEGGEISAQAIDLAQPDSTLSGYGTLDISGNYTGTGTIEATGAGILTVDGAVGSDIKLKIGGGADLQLNGQAGTSSDHGTVTFAGPDGTLDLTGEGRGPSGESAKFQDTVKNFAAGDKIEVAGASGDTLYYDSKHHTLDVENGGQIEETIRLSGTHTTADFNLSINGTTDTITCTCFMAGTLIATGDGNVPVEALKRGDLVLTTDGGAVPVAWLGRQTVSTVFGDPLRVLPIRIKAGAIGENVPARDLLLSPDHAILIDGTLIQAGALVNGTSFVREHQVPQTFTYYHVEVDDHALILAENTPAETFVDNVERLTFDNWAEHQALYPEGKSITELPLPRAKAHRQVPADIRVKLAERAQAIGAAMGGAAVA